jgi:hypothetical protein
VLYGSAEIFAGGRNFSAPLFDDGIGSTIFRMESGSMRAGNVFNCLVSWCANLVVIGRVSFYLPFLSRGLPVNIGSAPSPWLAIMA